MSNTLFLILFTGVLYGIIRYFSFLTRDKEAHQDGGKLSKLFVGRLFFWLGGITLLFFIYDIFRVQMLADRSFLLKGLIIVIATVLLLSVGEMIYQKTQKHDN